MTNAECVAGHIRSELESGMVVWKKAKADYKAERQKLEQTRQELDAPHHPARLALGRTRPAGHDRRGHRHRPAHPALTHCPFTALARPVSRRSLISLCRSTARAATV
jgi:hypothetical protein